MFRQSIIAVIAIGITAPIHQLDVVSAFTITHSLSTPMNLNAPISSYSLHDNEIIRTNERQNILRRPDVTPTSRRQQQQRRYLAPILSNSNSNNEETHHLDTDGSTPKRIYILGGGFGGLNTALTLASLPWPTTATSEEEGLEQQQQRPIITLVDRKERFVFLPLLYELCVGDAELEEVAPTFQTLLKDSNVEFLQREIEGVDVENSMVYLSQPPSSTTATKDQSRRQEGASYDALVIATGADVNLSAIPGAQSYAIPFYTVEDCFELRRTLALFKSVADTGGSNDADADVDTDRVVNVVVVGGGYSGVELALNVSERLKRSYSKVEITLVHRGDEILQYATEYNRKTGVDRLKKAGVTLKTGSSVVDVTPLHDAAEEEMESKFSSDYLNQKRCRVTLQPKSGSASTTADATDVLDADLLLWTAGASSTNIAKGVLNSILPRDSSGRVVTDTLLCTRAKGCESDSNVFALGDRARVARRKPYGATAQVAIQQASVVSWNVYASLLNGDDSATKSTTSEQQRQPLDLLPFSYLDLGEMLTLGEEDASITSLDGLVRLDGAGASILRRLIYAVRMPTARQALSAALLGAEKRVESLVGKQRQKQNNSSMKKKKMSWK